MPKEPLVGFNKLAEGQHLYTPPDSLSNVDVPFAGRPSVHPGLIIYCAWMFAAPRHIAKYIVQYHLLYPKARILLIQNNLSNMSWLPNSMQMRRLQPSVAAIKDFLETGVSEGQSESGRRQGPVILVHAFSNGGGHSLVQLAQAYRESFGPAESPSLPHEIPISALILDSCPGKATFIGGFNAAMSFIPAKNTLQRAVAAPFILALLTGMMVMHLLGVSEYATIKTWECLNDKTGPFLLSNGGESYGGNSNTGRATEEQEELRHIVPRTYIYSKKDDMVPERDVVSHAVEARGQVDAMSSTTPAVKIEDVIRLEEFKGSMHVNHVSVDAERYWRLVRETLESSAQA